MSVYLSEEEQVEKLKGFLKKYSSGILTLVLVITAAFAGWRYYLVQQSKAYNEGFNQYQQAFTASQKVEQNPTDKASLTTLRETVRKMSADHPHATFTVQAQLLLAKVEMNLGDTKNAVSTLKKAVDAAKDKGGLEQITQIRYARGLLQNNQPDAALQEINKVTDKAFTPTAQEVKGDIYMALNKPQDAKTAYQNAWDETVKRDDNRPILTLKLQALGVPVTPPKDKIINSEDGAE